MLSWFFALAGAASSKFPPRDVLRAATPAIDAALVGRSRLLAALVAATLALSFAGQLPGDAPAAAAAGLSADLRVGHTVKRHCRAGIRRRRESGRWTFTSGTPPTSEGSPMQPKAVYRSALYGQSCSRAVGTRCPGRSRPRSRAKDARGDRSARQAVSGDRVFTRRDERSDRLRPHAGADRRRRLRGRRALPRQQHPRRRADRLHQRAAQPGVHRVHVQRRAARAVLQDERPVEHGRPRQGHQPHPG